MKRIACFVLVLLLVLPIGNISAFADETAAKYGGIRYTLTTQPDKSGTIPVRVENSHVYADAEYVGALLGFNTIKNADTLVFQNVENTKLICFHIGTNKVEALNYIFSVLEYTAPFETIVEDSQFWVPLEFTLSVLDSFISFENEEILITPISETILSVVLKAHKNNQKYHFDFEDDFGYSEEVQKILGASNRIVSEYNELLRFNPEAALDLFLNVFGISNVYDDKYGEELAKLFVINSDEEFEAMNEDIDTLADVFSPNGKFRELFNSIEEWEVSNSSELANKYMDLIKAGNASNLELNAAYKQFERAFDSEKSFLESAAPFKQVQDTLAKDTHHALDILDQIFDVIQYASEYKNRDLFALNALKNYYDQGMKEDYIPEQITKTFASVIKALESSIGEYTFKNYLTNDLMLKLIESTAEKTIKEEIGLQISTTLLIWNIVSEYTPCLKESLDGADKFVLATYSQIFQSDSYRLLNSDSKTSENELYQVAQAYYTYLKFCYVTRQSALATIEAQKYVDAESYEKVKQYQLDINKEIADLLAVFKSAKINEDGSINNDNRIYGYLPSDNEKYLNSYSDEKLMKLFSGEGFSNNVTELETGDSSIVTTKEFYGGDGSIDNPYQISTPEQLNLVRNHLDSNFILVDDIDLSGYNWVPIGGTENVYEGDGLCGSFDGQGHTISNLNITYEIPARSGIATYSFGLFSDSAKSPGIKNFNLKNISINIIGQSTAMMNKIYISGVSVLASNISDVNVSGKIDISLQGENIYISGIANSADRVENCVNQADITASIQECSGYKNISGIVSELHDGVVKNCTNRGHINVQSYEDRGNTHCAGIVAVSGISEILNCSNKGKINCNAEQTIYLGGIVSESTNDSISGCSNYGNLESTSEISSSDVAGIVSQFSSTYYGGGATIKNCVNFGSISSKSDNLDSVYGNAYCGGIISRRSGDSWEISNCYNLANALIATGYSFEMGRISANNLTETGSAFNNYSLNSTLLNGVPAAEDIGPDQKNGGSMSRAEIEKAVTDLGFELPGQTE